MKTAGIEWTVRAGTQDANIVAEVVEHNTYRMPDSLAGFVVIDVGANIGAFTVLCLERGAEYVIAAEADHGNYLLLQENVAKHPRGLYYCTVEHKAVVGHWSGRSGREAVIPAGYHSWNGFEMTGGKNIFSDGGAAEVQMVRCECVCYLLERARRFSKKVIVKLDCEGAEHQILDGTPDLSGVSLIVGESHTIPPGFDPAYPDSEMSIVTLRACLERAGFDVRAEGYPTNDLLHLFWAERVA